MDVFVLATAVLKNHALDGGMNGLLARLELKRRSDNGSPYATRALGEIEAFDHWIQQAGIGCPECGERACSGSHVYVIELDGEASGHPKMLEANPGICQEGVPLYVGYTHHKIECNFENGHMGLNGDRYLCTCFDEEALRDRKPRRSTTHDFTPLRLRYDLSHGWNPIPSESGKAMEAELAELLRDMGFLVWQK